MAKTVQRRVKIGYFLDTFNFLLISSQIIDNLMSSASLFPRLKQIHGICAHFLITVNGLS